MKKFNGCPGMREIDMRDKKSEGEVSGKVPSQLRQWPIQLHLVNPVAPYYQGADVILTADCVSYAYGNFHNDFLKGKSIAIACPKLDVDQKTYVEKIKSLIEDAKINTLQVLIMEVPCCMGLYNIASSALNSSKRKVPIKLTVFGINGEIKSDEWM
jgi:hypothetical protein